MKHCQVLRRNPFLESINSTIFLSNGAGTQLKINRCNRSPCKKSSWLKTALKIQQTYSTSFMNNLWFIASYVKAFKICWAKPLVCFVLILNNKGKEAVWLKKKKKGMSSCHRGIFCLPLWLSRSDVSHWSLMDCRYIGEKNLDKPLFIFMANVCPSQNLQLRLLSVFPTVLPQCPKNTSHYHWPQTAGGKVMNECIWIWTAPDKKKKKVQQTDIRDCSSICTCTNALRCK